MLAKEIKKGESDTMEFKRTLPSEGRKLHKTVVAFANGEGVQKGTYVRVDATTRAAEPEKVRELQLYGSHLTYDEVVEHGAHPATDSEIRGLCEIIHDYMGLSQKRVSVKQLVSWGLLEQRGTDFFPTMAFRLLARGDVRFSGIQCARFEGSTRVHFLDRKFFDGPVYEQLENAQRFLLQYLKLGAEIAGIRRKDLYELPVAALREVLANAVIHRNYLVHGYIQVSIFDDRVEISSPGTLYDHLTKQQMLSGGSRLRNPLIAGIFMRMGIVEQWGTGIQRVFEICHANQIPPPTYSIQGDAVIATFHRLKEANPHREGKHPKITEKEAKLLAYLKANPTSSQRKAAADLGFKLNNIGHLFSNLRNKGYLTYVKSQEERYWQVKSEN